MYVLGQNSNYQNFIKNNNIIPDYARDYKNEYLFIRGIDKTCEKFVKILDIDGKIFSSPKADEIKKYFNKFLKAQQIEYLKDISDLHLREKDVEFIDSLELQLDDYRDIYFNITRYKPDENVKIRYENFFECFKRFKDKLRVNYLSEEDRYKKIIYDTDSDSDGEINIDDILNNYEDSETDSDSDGEIDIDYILNNLSEIDTDSD